MKTTTPSLLASAAAVLLVPLVGETQSTQDSDGAKRGRTTLEEIIVTAQKRQERLQDVPISISVLTGASLDRSTIEDVTEALRRVPGVSISSPFGLAGWSPVAVRGVSVSQSVNAGASTTAYYLDSVPFGFAKSAFAPDPDVYDLERIEVLRGPQGTLYGANALNGVVRVLTQEANLDDFEFKARTSGSSTKGGDENYRGDMAVNVPLLDGKIGARGIVSYQNWGGWLDKPIGRNVNDSERRSARLKVNAQPTEHLSIGASAWFSRDDYGAKSIGPQRAGQPDSLVDDPMSSDFDAYGLKIGYEFPWFSVLSTTSYLDFAIANRSELGSGLGRFHDARYEASTVAQELILNSKQGTAWRWSVGAMYRDSEDHQSNTFVNLFPSPNRIDNISQSSALFGELTRVFYGGLLDLTAGLRYFEDDVTLNEHSRLGPGVPPTQLVFREQRFHATTPRFALTWHPSTEMTAYVSYSEGFRSGVHQVPTVLSVVDAPSAAPDTLKNYELGTKGSLSSGRIYIDAAIYYIDWQDVQRQLLVPFAQLGGQFQTTVFNGSSASGIGVDFGLIAQPMDGLELGVNVGWNDLTSDADVSSGGVVLVNKGDRLDLSPEYTAGASAGYVFAIGESGLEGRISASANYTSEQLSRGLIAGLPTTKSGDSMLIARTGISIRTSGHWEATLFVDNVTDESNIPVRIFANTGATDIRIRPRTIGLQLDYRL